MAPAPACPVPKRPEFGSGPMLPAPSSSQCCIQTLRSLVNAESQSGEVGRGLRRIRGAPGPAGRRSRHRRQVRPALLRRTGCCTPFLHGIVAGPGGRRVHRREHSRSVWRWRRGTDRARAGLRGDRRRRDAAAAAPGVRGHLGRDDLRIRHRRAAPGLAARPGQRCRQGRVRDHRAGRGLQYPAHLHHRRQGRPGLGAERHQVLHLRGRRGRGAAGRRENRPGRARRPTLVVHRAVRRGGPGKAPAPGRRAAARAAIHPALRRASGSVRARLSAPKARVSGRCSTG